MKKYNPINEHLKLFLYCPAIREFLQKNPTDHKQSINHFDVGTEYDCLSGYSVIQ